MQIDEGGLDTFRSMAYKTPNRDSMEYLERYAGNFSNRISSRVSDYFEQQREIIKPMNFRELRSNTLAALRSLDNLFTIDAIQYLNEIGTIQHAPEVMRKYIMANPRVRRRYHEQRIDGYGENYTDRYPGQVEHEDPVYRSVMDGIVQQNEEGDCWYWDYDVAGDDYNEQDLTLEEKYEILDTWVAVDHLLDENQSDPTSQFNNNL